MKRLFFILSCTFFLLTLVPHSAAVAQILNAGFEDWAGGDPVSWFTSNYPTNAPSAAPITQTTIAHEGKYAIRGEIITSISIDTITPGPFEHRPHVTNSNLELDVRGFAISSRPRQLRGWLMYQPGGDGERIGLTVYMFRNGSLVGTGRYGRFGTSSDTAYKQFAAQINYFNADIPDTIYFSFGYTSSNIGSVFYLDDLSLTFLEILEPKAEDVFVAGERDTITWDVATGNIDIYYSVDSGSTFRELATNYPADSGRYLWDVPDTLLSTRALVKIINSADASDTALSERFYIKPWQLTRIDGSGDFELFVPAEDGWSAANSSANSWPQSWWQQFDYLPGTDPNTGVGYPALNQFVTAQPGDFPDWPLFVDVFGVPQCYLGSSSPPMTYSTRAVSRWAVIKGTWGGSCAGYAVSSLLGFYHQASLVSRFPGIGSFTDLFTVPVSDDSRSAVNQYYTHQFGNPFRAYENQRWSTVDARQTLRELKEMFSKNNTDAMRLAFYNNNGSGGHAVTGYRLERNGTSAVFTLRVYDSNIPGSTTQIITIDSTTNMWTEGTGLGWGSGMTGCLLGLPSVQHFTTPTLSITPGMQPRAAVRPSNAASDLEIYNTSGASIIIKGLSGDSVGYVDSVSFGNLAGAVPIIPKTGSFHPPIGYVVPVDDYSLTISDVPGTAGFVSFFTDSLLYNYRRTDFQGGQTDLLTYSDGVGMKNPDGATKSVGIETIVSVDSTERIFSVSGLEMFTGDSMAIREFEHEALLMKNFGTATTYDLEVRFATGAGVDRFFHASVPIGAGTSHQVVPDWGDVEGIPMKILIDAGNDGSIDDSMFVSNELTEVEDRISTGIPARYGLLQNYPNPFNPMTTITFDIPELSDVSLKVYTLAGEEITTLVDGVRQPGTYRVSFDGSDLPSGVYIYRMTAGKFTAGGKMILMK